MKQIRAVLFDLAGTLVEPPAGDAGRRLAAALGLGEEQAGRITSLIVRTTFGSPEGLAARLRSELGLAADPTAAVTAVWQTLLTGAREIPGATTCVSAVRSAGAKIALLADVSEPEAGGFRHACSAIAPLVDGWQLSCDTGAVKPSAAVFQAALAALEVEPAYALMVGDSLEGDIGPALALGMSALWLRRAPVVPTDAPSVVTVDPHRAPVPIPAEIVPEGALTANSLSQVRRIVLTWMWAGRGLGGGLTMPLPPEKSPG